MSDYHEPENELSEGVRNAHRALTSLKEEIEAIDWYHQRVVLCQDEELRAVLAHNRDEEMEHASMTLEWLRRNMPGWDEALRMYLFTEGSITKQEKETTNKAQVTLSPGTEATDLGIGSLKGEK